MQARVDQFCHLVEKKDTLVPDIENFLAEEEKFDINHKDSEYNLSPAIGVRLQA